MTTESGLREQRDQSIRALCKRFETLAPGALAGVCIADANRTQIVRSVFPGLPETFESAITAIPMAPPYFGACNAVIREGAVITCHDLSRETRFDAQFVQLCLQHGVRALQSWPVYGRDKRPVGTFVIGYGESRTEKDFDAALMKFAADAVSELLQAEIDSQSA